MGRTGLVSLPPFCTTDDDMIVDDRGRINRSLMNGDIEPHVYASILMRSTLMGKKGMLRYECMGMRPLSSVRRVAVCNWSVSPHHRVLVPSVWMEKIKIPTTTRSKDGYSSPYWSFRSARSGGKALLMRCPSIFDTSVMGVEIISWDQAATGVHPAMCEFLNLDYDGDEVHIDVLDDALSVREIDRLIALRTDIDKFSDRNMQDVYTMLQMLVLKICTAWISWYRARVPFVKPFRDLSTRAWPHTFLSCRDASLISWNLLLLLGLLTQIIYLNKCMHVWIRFTILLLVI